MKTLIINSAESKERAFVDPIAIALINQTKLDLKEYRDIDSSFNPSVYDAIIISASPKGDNGNFKERMSHFWWLVDCNTPILGICAGHQLIGVTFGAILIKDSESEEGILEIDRLKNEPLFDGYEKKLMVTHHHKDSITLPDDFELLASSPTCKNQAMKHQSKMIYSMQWHAEESNLDIIQNFIKLIKSKSA